ncbi:MAG: tetratricopeptide repeat protein [Planctomycetota bacterium]|jgi:tetratricopeptide (TPR) repeat protein/tRNA A-37 threonylcarbamoyl transferase component Bud32
MSIDNNSDSDRSGGRQADDILAARRQVEQARQGAEPWDAGPSPVLHNERGQDSSHAMVSIPGYTIMGEIHRGGQGVVYEATQESTRRKVAIKIIHQRAASGDVARLRFERETHVLGRLNHPHIVTIHDSGIADGHAYFVMDYVKGLTLDAYAARQELTVDQLLRLFITICDALHEAHVRGIIHRDLKPGNILVDDRGAPRILDFGLAKITEDIDASSAQAVTVTGQFLGSMPWSSPEQAEGRWNDNDTRSDVYSLGVIFYQILTGTFPYPVVGAIRDVVRNIVEVEPRRPSSVRYITDDFETILLKALSKEPQRRYQSAGDFAADLRRLRANEPIDAKRDSHWYVMTKSLSRHRAVVAVVALVAVLLTVGLGVSTTLWQRAVEQRDRALNAEKLAEERLADVSAARDDAQREALRSQTVERFLGEMLASVTPGLALGRDTTLLREILKTAAARADTELIDQVEVAASVHHTIGNAYESLGLYQPAEHHLRQSLEMRRDVLDPNHPDIARSLTSLGVLFKRRGEYDNAAEVYRESLQIRRKAPQNASWTLVTALTDLGELKRVQNEEEASEAYFREALEIMKGLSGSDSHAEGTLRNNYGLLLRDQGKMKLATDQLRQALKIFERELGEHPLTANTLSNLATCLMSQGERQEPEALLQIAIPLQERFLPPDHPQISQSLNSLANILHDKGDLQAAETTYRRVIEALERIHGGPHPDIATTQNNLAIALQDMGRMDEAESLFRDTLQLRRSLFDGDHRDLAQSLNGLGVFLLNKKDFAGAEPYLNEAVEMSKRVSGPDHPVTANYVSSQISAMYKLHQYDRIEAPLIWIIDMRKKQSGDRDPMLMMFQYYLGHAYHELKRCEDALPVLEESILLHKMHRGAQFIGTGLAMRDYGSCLAQIGRFEDAEPVLLEAQQVLNGVISPTHHHTATAKQCLVDLYRDWKKPVEENAWRQKLPPVETGGDESK